MSARSSSRRVDRVTVGVGAAACAVCCAGPITAALAAIGIAGTGALVAFGVVTAMLVVVVASVALGVRRRRRRSAACAGADTPVPVAVTISSGGART